MRMGSFICSSGIHRRGEGMSGAKRATQLWQLSMLEVWLVLRYVIFANCLEIDLNQRIKLKVFGTQYKS